MCLCITQPILFSPLCFDNLVLAPHSAYRKACSKKTRQNAAVLKEHVALELSVSPLAFWPLSGVSVDCASTFGSVCEKYGSLSMNACQSCFSRFDAVHLKTCRSGNTSV